MIDQHLTNKDIEQLITQPDFCQANVQGHLDSCSDCQGRVEAATADPWWWNEGREFVVSSLVLAETVGQAPGLDQVSNGYDPVEAEIEKLVDSFNPPRHPELLGRVGEYDVHSLIGVGGMGAVFKGFDQELNRPVAIKFLLPRHANSGAARQRFSREAKAIAAVRDDNVIPVFRINATADFPHFAMPLITGISLQQYVQVEGMVGAEQLVQVSMQIAAGLQAAHETGLIHRDVKPSNILLENECNRVVVTDFGLAREENEQGLTQTGMVAGTPLYMSPEQSDGRQLDHRSDLFSLGAVMYFMATGRPPFEGSNQLELLKNIRQSQQPLIRRFNPTISPRLEQMVERLLAKDPSRRFQTAAEVKDFLTNYAAHLNSPATNDEPKLARQWRWNSKTLVVLCSLLLLVTTVGLAIRNSTWFAPSGPSPIAVVETGDDQFAKNLTLESKEMNAYFADASNVPRVRGEIKSITKKEMSDLVIEYYMQVPSKLQKSGIAKVDRNGHFDLKLDYPFPYQEVMLKIGDLYFGSFVVHRDLTIQIDFKKLKRSKQKHAGDGITFLGSDAPMVAYQVKYRLSSMDAVRRLRVDRAELESRLATDSKKLIVGIEKSFAQEKVILDRFIKDHPSKHAWILLDDFYSSLYGHILGSGMIAEAKFSEALWNDLLSHQPKILSAGSSDYYHHLNLFLGAYNKVELWKKVLYERVPTTEKEGLEEFFQLLAKLYESKSLQGDSRRKFDEGRQKYVMANIDWIIKEGLDCHVEKLRELGPQKANVVMVMGARATASPKEYMQAIVPMVNEGWCKTILLEQHQMDVEHSNAVQNKIKRALQSGPSGLGQSLMSTDGMHLYFGNQTSADEVAESIVKAFPGKAIIVDFWSMSCGACLEDMKNSKDTKKELADLPVEIVYVCLDSQYETWMEKIVGNAVTGNHLFLKKELSAKVMEHFKIASFPSFIFIDQDGNYDSKLVSFLSGLNVEKVRSKLKPIDK